MISNLFFLQVVDVDGVSMICPKETNNFIPHQTRLNEKGKEMRDECGNLLNFAIVNL